MAYSYEIQCNLDTSNPLSEYDVVSNDILDTTNYFWDQN